MPWQIAEDIWSRESGMEDANGSEPMMTSQIPNGAEARYCLLMGHFGCSETLDAFCCNM